MPLTPPPRDPSGKVVPHDHAEILPVDGVIRRISHQQVVDDQLRGCRRISSIAFKASTGNSNGMSIDLQREIEEAGLNPRVFVTTLRWIGSVRFVAGELRGLSFQVGYDPLESNPYHGEVWGAFNKVQQDGLRIASQWFVEIPGVAIR